MSDSLERRLDEIEQLLNNLVLETQRGIPIIVEGLSDAKSLNKLRVKGNFFFAKTQGKSFESALGEIESSGKDEVILLLDFDKRGREMTFNLKNRLENRRIKVNLIFWKKFLGLIGRDVKDVEGLATYIQTLYTKLGKYFPDQIY
ncbi:toprim domain-containing protein [Candidatus Bathyarchaeota archaeon]|nr:toprim domain-containing protein [Candidatus Bathyarchaeota archaeon]